MSTNIQSSFTLTEEEQERLGAEEQHSVVSFFTPDAEELIQLASEIRNSSAVSAELMLDLLHEQKQTWPPQSASGQCDVSDWKDIVAVAVGGNHTVGLCADGTVLAAGSNENGQCNVSGWNLNQPSDLPPGTKGKASWITKFFPFSH